MASTTIKHPSDLAGIDAPAGSRFTVALTGAVYVVSLFPDLEYNAGEPDGCAVIGMDNGLFACLQEQAGVYLLSWFQSDALSDTGRLQTAIDYAAANDARTVRIIGDVYLDDTVTLRMGVRVEGTFVSGRSKHRSRTGTTIWADLRNQDKPVFRFPDEGGGYMQGISLSGVEIVAQSAAKCAVEINKPFMSELTRIGVDGTESKFFESAFEITGGIMTEISHCFVENCVYGFYFPLGQWGTTTMNLYKCYIRETETAIQIKRGRAAALSLDKCTVERSGSVIISDSLKNIRINELYTESMTGALYFDLGRFPVMEDDRDNNDGGVFILENSKITGPGIDNSVAIVAGYVDLLSIVNTRFGMFERILTTKQKTNRVIVSGVVERGIKQSIADLAGIARPETATVISSGDHFEAGTVIRKIKIG